VSFCAVRITIAIRAADCEHDVALLLLLLLLRCPLFVQRARWY
jgi:hypothetical protein